MYGSEKMELTCTNQLAIYKLIYSDIIDRFIAISFY